MTTAAQSAGTERCISDRQFIVTAARSTVSTPPVSSSGGPPVIGCGVAAAMVSVGVLVSKIWSPLCLGTDTCINRIAAFCAQDFGPATTGRLGRAAEIPVFVMD